MSIILKHIFRNIKEHKLRSILIFLALLVSTCVLIIDIILPDELFIKIEDTYKTIYGETNILINTVDDFTLNDIKVNDEKFDYIGVNKIDVTNKNNKPTEVIGIDIKKAKKFKLLGDDVTELNDNEVVINEYSSKEKGYKKGDSIELTYNNKKYTFIIKDIIKKKGIAAIENENDMFITNISLVNKLKNQKEGTYSAIYFDVENDENVDKLIEYIKENNKNYNVQKTIDVEGLKEELSFVRYLMTLIFFMSTIMIFFVIGSLNKIMLAERIPVIGTFRSIGADRKKMNTILIIENSLYGLFAGLFGSLAGIRLDRIVSKNFISTSGVELSTKSIKISPSLIIIGIVFAILLQVFITAKEIIRTNKKPIKTLIFNTQNSRYRIRKVRTIVGFIFIVLAFIVHILNTKINILMTMTSLILLTTGIANIVPLLMQWVSKILTKIFKKIGWSTGIIASKNIGYNKMIIASSRLIVVSLSLLSTIVLVSNAFTKAFTSFREVTKGYQITIMNASETAEKYDKLVEIDGITKVDYIYYYAEEKITYNDNKKFNTVPIIYTTNKKTNYIESKKEIKDLKKDEIIIDEKIGFKNNLKVGDTLTLHFGELKKDFTFKIVGLCDSSSFTTSRNLVAINYDLFIKEITDTPLQMMLKADDNVDLEKMKETLKEEIKEVNLKVQTVKEYIDNQEKQTESIMGIFYVILGLSVFLSFIGIVNNQVISFMQRRRELAVLNSTCMSKSQLRKMLLTETIIANLVASILVLIVSYASVIFINYFMQGIDLYITIKYDLITVLKFVGIVYVILLFTLIIPIRKLKKMNIVNEIKYE